MPSSRNKAEVSVIVPCRNPGPFLHSLLSSLAEQKFELPWEVIIIDNCCTDDTRSVAETYSDRLPLRVVDAPGRTNASYARNTGARAAIGKKLLFVDADDEVESGYVTAMSGALDVHDFVASRVDAVSLNPEWSYKAQSPAWQETGVEVIFDFLPAAGINIGIRPSLFEKVGGFPEKYTGSQDIALSWNVQLRTGTNIHFVPEAVYLYRHRKTLFEMYRQSCNWGFSNVLLYRQFREYGMPGKTWRMAIWEWKDVMIRLWKARTGAEKAPQIVRLGYCVGRLKGSIRYGVAYL